MTTLSHNAQQALAALSRALSAEQREARARTEELFAEQALKALEARGVYLRRARVSDVRPALSGRVRVNIADDGNRVGHVERFMARAGASLHVVEEVDGARRVVSMGVVARRRGGELEVVLDAIDELDLDAGDSISLMLGADEVTLRRLQGGLAAAGKATGRHARLVELLLAVSTVPPTKLRDDDSDVRQALSALNDDQRIAARHALYQNDVALVHGPPGTGKTHVLTAVVQAAVSRGERVLCMCASNAATDHLALSVLSRDAGISLVRVGDPARVHALLEENTLAARCASHPHSVTAKKLLDDAHAGLRHARRRSDSGREAHLRAKEARQQAATLRAEARELEAVAIKDVLDKTRVLCGTLTGGSFIHGDVGHFDVLIVDEASQATTPALLLALPLLSKEGRVVLAGDHRQLPPVVLAKDAAALADTAFSRLREADAQSSYSHLLTVQHRMNEALMAFPSRRFYDDKLTAHAGVAHRVLASDDADHMSMPSRVFDVIDTAGAGFDELRAADSSIENAGEAKVVALLVHDLIAVGVAAADIGIVTPYAAQAALLRRAVDVAVEVDSVDGFQGREKRVMVCSLVRSNAEGLVGFVPDERRMNVSLTRAMEKLIVIGDSATLSTSPVWRALFDDAIARGAYRSVFELNADIF